MARILKAVQYSNLDDALKALRQCSGDVSIESVLNDGGEEPQGLLAIVAEDRLTDEIFYRLFDLKMGTVVEVERIGYSGYGPPAEEDDYIGYISEQRAYVLRGCRYPIEIRGCPLGALDIHHLEALVLDQQHPLNRDDLANRVQLSDSWDFDELFDLIRSGQHTATELDRLIHLGIQ